ncbi:hypothetical protein CDAR_73531 [Caerostris darwini]|uniref:Maturase K n=1 Tax=Caerostris darwini TaxID=1538125 RepID=A0AAV4VMS4_9ARAC|nr:hypothetical protein CDAR_73531 [Caerostris darwini]
MAPNAKFYGKALEMMEYHIELLLYFEKRRRSCFFVLLRNASEFESQTPNEPKVGHLKTVQSFSIRLCLSNFLNLFVEERLTICDKAFDWIIEERKRFSSSL